MAKGPQGVLKPDWKQQLQVIGEELAKSEAQPELKLVSNIEEPKTAEQAEALVSSDKLSTQEEKRISDIRELAGPAPEVAPQVEASEEQAKTELSEARERKKKGVEEIIKKPDKKNKISSREKKIKALENGIETAMGRWQEADEKQRRSLKRQIDHNQRKLDRLKNKSIEPEEAPVEAVEETPPEPEPIVTEASAEAVEPAPEVASKPEQAIDLIEGERQRIEAKIREFEAKENKNEEESIELRSWISKLKKFNGRFPQPAPQKIEALPEPEPLEKEKEQKGGGKEEATEPIHKLSARQEKLQALEQHLAGLVEEDRKINEGFIRKHPGLDKSKTDEDRLLEKKFLETKSRREEIEELRQAIENLKSKGDLEEAEPAGIHFSKNKFGFRVEPSKSKEIQGTEKRDWEAERQKIMEEVARMEEEPEKFGGIRVEPKVIETLKPKPVEPVEEVKKPDEVEAAPEVKKTDEPVKIEEPVKVEPEEKVEELQELQEYQPSVEFAQKKAGLEADRSKLKSLALEEWSDVYAETGAFDRALWDKLKTKNSAGQNEKKRFQELKINLVDYEISHLESNERLKSILHDINLRIDKQAKGKLSEDAKAVLENELAGLRQQEKDVRREIVGIEDLRNKDKAEERGLIIAAKQRVEKEAVKSTPVPEIIVVQPDRLVDPHPQVQPEVILSADKDPKVLAINEKIKEIEKALQAQREAMPQTMGVRGVGLEGDDEALKRTERIMAHYKVIKDLESQLEALQAEKKVVLNGRSEEKPEGKLEFVAAKEDSKAKVWAKKIGKAGLIGGGVATGGIVGGLAGLHIWAIWPGPRQLLELLMKITKDPGGAFKSAWNWLEKFDASKIFKKNGEDGKT